MDLKAYGGDNDDDVNDDVDEKQFLELPRTSSGSQKYVLLVTLRPLHSGTLSSFWAPSWFIWEISGWRLNFTLH